jgi:hypothetical protein
MLYRLLADGVLVIHLVFIVFVVSGGLLLLKWRRLAWVHAPSMTWGVLNEFFGWWCPLTPLENWLRVMGGAAGYSGGFIEHYVMPVVYPADLTRGLQIAFATVVVMINGLIYGILCRKLLKAGKLSPSGGAHP